MIWMATFLALATPMQNAEAEPSTSKIVTEEEASLQAEALAKAAEEKAFAAIETERWCDAMNSFLDSNAYKSSPALLFNAANAAEFGGDNARARLLFQEFLDTAPSGEQKSSAEEKLNRLTDISQRVCVLSERPQPPEATKDVPVVEKNDPPILNPKPPSPTLAIGPIATMATGGTMIAGGGVAIAVGLIPYFGHRAKAAEIREAEAEGRSATELQSEQKALRESWEGYGEVTYFAGIASAAIGALLVGGGAAWLTLGSE